MEKASAWADNRPSVSHLQRNGRMERRDQCLDARQMCDFPSRNLETLIVWIVLHEGCCRQSLQPHYGNSFEALIFRGLSHLSFFQH